MPRKHQGALQRGRQATSGSFKKGDARAKKAGEAGATKKRVGRPPDHAKRAIDAALRAELDGQPSTRDLALQTVREAVQARDDEGNPTPVAIRACELCLAYTDKKPEQPVAVEGSMKGATVNIIFG